MAAATTSSPKTSPQRPKGLLQVTIRRGAFVAGGDELEEQVRGFGFEGDVADLVDDQQRVAAEADELVLQPAGVVGVGEAGDPFGGGGEQRPGARLGRRGSPRPMARWVLPVPGGPRKTTFSLAVTKSRVPRWAIRSRLRPRAWSKSNSSRLLRAGNRAARMRPSPPWDSRAETSRCRQAARNSSWVQDSARARSASRVDRLAQGRRLQRAGQERQLGGDVAGRAGRGRGHHATPPSTSVEAEGACRSRLSGRLLAPRSAAGGAAAARPGRRRSAVGGVRRGRGR